MSEYKMRTTEITVMRNNSCLNDGDATRIAIADENAGEFIAIGQGDQLIRIDPDEWHQIRLAVNNLMADIEYQAKEDGEI